MTNYFLKIFLVSCFIFLLPGLVSAFTAGEVINYGAPALDVYPKEFDKLILDITIPSGNPGQSDKLLALTVQNEGTARQTNEISRLTLWRDAGEQGFQGMGVDEKIGNLLFYSQPYSWRLPGLSVEVPASGLRLFVSAETVQSPTVNKYFQMKLSVLLDNNGNGLYDLDDLGVYLESQNNGPSDAFVLNTEKQILRNFILDNKAPKAVIAEPAFGEILEPGDYLIKGKARDQGGSTVQWVKIGITPEGGSEAWHFVELEPASHLLEQDFEYNWRDIAEGSYTLRVQSADWIQSEAISEREITVSVAALVEPELEPEPEEPVEPEEPEEPNSGYSEDEPSEDEEAPEDGATPDKQARIAGLKAQIAEIQQMIVELLGQLIALLKAKL